MKIKIKIMFTLLVFTTGFFREVYSLEEVVSKSGDKGFFRDVKGGDVKDDKGFFRDVKGGDVKDDKGFFRDVKKVQPKISGLRYSDDGLNNKLRAKVQALIKIEEKRKRYQKMGITDDSYPSKISGLRYKKSDNGLKDKLRVKVQALIEKEEERKRYQKMGIDNSYPSKISGVRYKKSDNGLKDKLREKVQALPSYSKVAEGDYSFHSKTNLDRKEIIKRREKAVELGLPQETSWSGIIEHISKAKVGSLPEKCKIYRGSDTAQCEGDTYIRIGSAGDTLGSDLGERNSGIGPRITGSSRNMLKVVSGLGSTEAQAPVDNHSK